MERAVADLHPMAVHLPIGLVLLYPFLELAAAVTRRRELSIVALSVLGVAVVSSLFASTTGEAAYDAAVEVGYAHEILETHEELAERVPWLLIAGFAVRFYLELKTKFGAWVGAALGLGLIAFIIRVGDTGGELVYQHGVGVKRGAAADPKAGQPVEARYEDEAEEDVSDPHEGLPQSPRDGEGGPDVDDADGVAERSAR